MLAHWDAEKAAWGNAIQRKLPVAPSTGAGLEVLVKKVRSIRPTRVYLPLQTSVQGALRPCRTTLTSHGWELRPHKKNTEGNEASVFSRLGRIQSPHPFAAHFFGPF